MHPHSVKNHKTNQVFEHFDPTFPIQTRNKTKSNPIRNLLRLPIQTKKKKKKIYLGFALVAWRFIVRLACRSLR